MPERESTLQDEQLTRLKGYINTGFLCDKKNLPTDLHEFWLHREMLSIESGLITCRTRIIVPREMRPEMFQYIHEGHQGKEHCLLMAKNTLFWPKITYDIQQLIEKCIICQEYGKSQPLIGTTQELDYLCLYQITFGNFQLSISSVKIYLLEYSKKCFYFKICKILNKMIPKLLYHSKI